MSRSRGGRRPRRRFSEEFKEGAVARELDLTESALRLWVEHARAVSGVDRGRSV